MLIYILLQFAEFLLQDVKGYPQRNVIYVKINMEDVEGVRVCVVSFVFEPTTVRTTVLEF